MPASCPARWQVAAGTVAVAAAGVLLWSLSLLANLKVLTSVRFEAGWISAGVHNLARVPVSFYGTALRVFLTAAVPVAFLTTVPAQLVIGSLTWWWAGVAVGVAAVVTVVTRLAWEHQVRRYSGAMS